MEVLTISEWLKKEKSRSMTVLLEKAKTLNEQINSGSRATYIQFDPKKINLK